MTLTPSPMEWDEGRIPLPPAPAAAAAAHIIVWGNNAYIRLQCQSTELKFPSTSHISAPQTRKNARRITSEYLQLKRRLRLAALLRLRNTLQKSTVISSITGDPTARSETSQTRELTSVLCVYSCCFSWPRKDSTPNSAAILASSSFPVHVADCQACWDTSHP